MCCGYSTKRPRLRVPTLASQNRAKGTRRPAASKCAKSAAVPLHNNTHHHTHTLTKSSTHLNYKNCTIHSDTRINRLHYFGAFMIQTTEKNTDSFFLPVASSGNFNAARERLEVTKRWNGVLTDK